MEGSKKATGTAPDQWKVRPVKFTEPYLPRGRRSRNKVSVGEPAEGSFAHARKHKYVDYYANSVRGYSFFISFQIFMGGGLDGVKSVPVCYHFRIKPKHTIFVLRHLRL